MDPRSQLLIINEKIAELGKEEHQLEVRRRDFFDKIMMLTGKKNSNLVALYQTIIKEFDLKKNWFSEINKNQSSIINNIPLESKRYLCQINQLLNQQSMNFLWSENSSVFKKSILEYVGKIHDRDPILFKHCDDLLNEINEIDKELDKIKQDVELIHKDTEAFNLKFNIVEQERDILMSIIEKYNKAQLEKDREVEKTFIENLKLTVNDKLFWKDKGVGINESQRKEPASIGRYRKVLNDDKLSDNDKIERLQEIATKKMKEFRDKKMEKGETFFKGKTGKMVEKKVYPLLVKLHEFILERKDHLLNEIQNEMRNTRPVEKKSPSFKLSDEDL